MKVIKGEQKYISYLTTIIDESILFIGAGFCKNEQTKFGKTLLDGKELKDYFIKKILEVENENKQILQKYSFADISELFFKVYKKSDKYNEIKIFFKEHFTKVFLSSQKQEFLKNNWKNIYTLNIDDAIENTTGYEVVLPNKKLDRKIIEEFTPLIFKLHGDVKKNLIYGNEIEEQIIFSKTSYIKQLMQNNQIYDIFLSNYKDYNTIFIGVSFDDEIDIEGYIENEVVNLNKSLKRILVTSSEPDLMKKMKLEKIGINEIIIVDAYTNFYQLLNQECKKNNNDLSIGFMENFIFQEQNIKKSKDDNIKFLLGENIISFQNKIIYNPYFHIKRDKYDEIIKKLKNNYFIALKGKRFSGKTYLLAMIYLNMKELNKLFFTSELCVDTSKIVDLIENISNTIFIFDTNSFSEALLKYINNNKKILIENNNKFIFAFDYGDLIESYFYKNNYFNICEIENKLSLSEIKQLNLLLDQLGIIKFKENTIIETLFGHFNKYYKDKRSGSTINKNIYNIINKFDNLSETDKTIVLSSSVILLAHSKFYSSIFYMLFKNANKFGMLKDFFEYIIEKEKTLYEQDSISGFKYSLECNSCMYFFIKYLVDNKKIKVEYITMIIENMVKKLYKTRYSYVVKKIINFNFLNFIFAYKNKGGARKVIFSIYESLNQYLYEDEDYWLQRAKSILHLSHNDIKQITDGIDYAKKTYYDTNKSKKEIQVLFTIALLYGRKVSILKFQNMEVNLEALDFYYKAFQENRYNKNYIESIFKRKKDENDFYQFIEYLNKQNLDRNNRNKVNELYQKMINFNNKRIK